MKTEIKKFAEGGSEYWWTSLIAGMLYILLGIWFIATPASAILALTYVFVIGFFMSGIFDITFALSNRSNSGWKWPLAGGIIDIVFGFVLIALPQPTITTLLVFFIGFWILFRSIWILGMAFKLNKYENAGWLIILGIILLIFSIAYLFNPTFGGITVLLLASFAFISYGLFRIYYAIRLRSLDGKSKRLLKNSN